MDWNAGNELANQLSFEQFRRQIPRMSHDQRGDMLEKLAYSHFVVHPAAIRLAAELRVKAPAAWEQTTGAWVIEGLEQVEESCAESHW